MSKIIFIKTSTALKSLFKIIVIFLAIANLNSYAASQKLDDVSKLERDYQKISTVTYRELTQKSDKFKLTQGNLPRLTEDVYRAERNNQPELAIALVTANMNLIKQNLAADDLQTLVGILLKHHAVIFAEEVLELAKLHGDDYLLGRVEFEFVKYYAGQNNWQQAIAYLNNIDIANTLPKQEGDEAFIILGATLQHEKKHRQALEYYARVKSDSIHYRVAQLNTAVAFIRQDWWTDAHIAIKHALKAGPKNNNDELANRLYSVMGFSQLQHGFYRDARESFRNVNIKSHYSNRALLGIGMAALHQEDYIGALNAFNHLKKKDAADISVAESYLLSAFALEKLGQQKTASASYTEAIVYYEQQIAYYDKFLNELEKKKKTNNVVAPTLAKQINSDGERSQPGLIALTSKINSLSRLLEYRPSANTEQAVSKLINQMNQTYIDLASESLTEKQTIMNSYLSQARFGLAKLFDNQ